MMRSLPCIALALLQTLAGSALACTQSQIEAATMLVLQANPVILAQRDELAGESRQRDWSARLTLGYTRGSNDNLTAPGANAGIQVEIPLFDRANELKLFKARLAFQQRQDGVLSDFLGQMLKLCSKADRVRELDTMHRFYRDRLQYRKEQVKEGLEGADSLWKETEKAQEAEYDYRRDRGELAAMQLAVARRFGGEEWKRLQVLLAEASR